MTVHKMTVHKMTVHKMTEDKMTEDKMTVVKITVDNMIQVNPFIEIHPTSLPLAMPSNIRLGWK